MRTMGVGGAQRNITGYFLALFTISLLLINGEINFDYPSNANAPISWTNNNSDSSWDSEEVILKPIFVNGDFVCGFHCKVEENSSCFFAISIFISEGSYPISKMVWSANQNNPVGRRAKLQLSQQEGLTLQDGDNTLVWSANTAGKSVLGLRLTDHGKLKLFDRKNKIVWQSSPSAQIHPSPVSPKKNRRLFIGVILGSTLGASFFVLLICFLFFRQIKRDPKDVEEDYLGHISGAPSRFSYEELKFATDNFSNKVGEGGFGCVFQGKLPGGAQVAVKYLDGFGFVKKSFITEVETIGSIHHFNLVRLVGFCAEKFRMLLVYEYMCNGSLDQWIFCRDKRLSLGWQYRRKIILDIAKGLAYLHEGCRQKVIHFDIKPQNILLDENFNAKVSDFGLSKLVGREQSQVMTTMRGTPGYMAPEWLNSVITEKVDVYSFGIVVLEILCGRKNVDRSLPEEDGNLVSLFKRKADGGELLDLMDKYNEEMQSNAAEVMEMMKVVAWCLQSEYAKRPSMSIMVKFLEGKMDDENEYDLSNPPALAEVETLGHQMDAAAVTASPLIPSILSGPR